MLRSNRADACDESRSIRPPAPGLSDAILYAVRARLQGAHCSTAEHRVPWRKIHRGLWHSRLTEIIAAPIPSNGAMTCRSHMPPPYSPTLEPTSTLQPTSRPRMIPVPRARKPRPQHHRVISHLGCPDQRAALAPARVSHPALTGSHARPSSEYGRAARFIATGGVVISELALARAASPTRILVAASPPTELIFERQWADGQ